MKGKLYSVGVGPGDPELMTLKAVRLIKECDVLAIPQGDSDVLVAKNIVEGIVDLSKKEQLLVYMPMVKDHDIISSGPGQERGVYYIGMPHCLRYLYLRTQTGAEGRLRSIAGSRCNQLLRRCCQAECFPL